ncbi:MAG: DegV family protein [Anaerolineae bacterium]|nr:DegV family protein [Anaerolineae bacterium]
MIHIVTDTTAYLPASILGKWSIRAVPLKVHLANRAVDQDENKVELAAFFRDLSSVETAPTTSQPAPGDFITVYETLTRGTDEVLSIHISDHLSGTLRVAQMAAHEVAPDRITVVNSRSATCGLALMVDAAIDALHTGASRLEAAARVEEISRDYAGIFLVENLEYLAKGGRINGAAKFLGSMLHLRPILYMNDGKIDGLTVARTRKRGMQQIVDEVRKRVGEGPIRAGVTHIQCPEEASLFAEQIQQKFDTVSFFVHETGPVIGSHVGPGFIGLAACRAGI